jgi:hypothetical protein
MSLAEHKKYLEGPIPGHDRIPGQKTVIKMLSKLKRFGAFFGYTIPISYIYSRVKINNNI